MQSKVMKHSIFLEDVVSRVITSEVVKVCYIKKGKKNK